jgi:hypothetical protein
VIKGFIRLVIRLGLLTGIGLALFKVLKGRRSASEFGSPSADWAPPPAPNPNLPKAPPEPELVEPVMFEEIIEKKAAIRAVPEPVSQPDAVPAPKPAPTTDKAPDSAIPGLAGQPGAKKPAAKQSSAKKAAPAAPAAAGPVNKVAPKKASTKKAAPPATPEKAPTAKKAAPAKKAPKKTQ